MKRIAALTLLLAGACIPSEGPMMAPFEDCLGCHGGSGGDAKAWTAAGTWAKGARVQIVDANGKTVNLRGNDAGNFYTAESLAFPLTVSVDGKVMPDPAVLTTPRPAAKLAYGGCNACHRAETLTVGELMAPGSDCLVCHGTGGMAATKFSAAGTFPPPAHPVGSVVNVGGRTATTNSVGNFYIPASQPIAFPATASVAGHRMPDPVTYGGCGRCHGPGGEAGGGD
jgi:hypothetical protein